MSACVRACIYTSFMCACALALAACAYVYMHVLSVCIRVCDVYFKYNAHIKYSGGRSSQRHYTNQQTILYHTGPSWQGWQATAWPEETCQGREVLLLTTW